MIAAALVGAEGDERSVRSVHGTTGFEARRGERHGFSPCRGSDHSTLWTSAITVSPAGARLAEPLVAALNDRESPSRWLAATGTVPTAVTAPAAPAAASS